MPFINSSPVPDIGDITVSTTGVLNFELILKCTRLLGLTMSLPESLSPVPTVLPPFFRSCSKSWCQVDVYQQPGLMQIQLPFIRRVKDRTVHITGLFR
ncbi:hypothetical protein HOLleu_32361 [Holothuria leucospilota]|uniref:Uncharacterized protein n=1 Tax=Holothuria leucospilota TaxID=206669 RepID=A0A9Q1BIK3_HOLLE|nr:hypothetical protein HOLleu_32361 [Holothuria leucospilota]